jgi:hypothetical protein
MHVDVQHLRDSDQTQICECGQRGPRNCSRDLWINIYSAIFSSYLKTKGTINDESSIDCELGKLLLQ